MAVDTLFGQVDIGLGAALTDTSDYTFGMQFHVTAACTLTGIYFWTGTGATSLPAAIGLYQVTGTGTGTLLESVTSPTWVGTVGSNVWARASFAGTTSLTTGVQYKIVAFKGSGTKMYSNIAHYWDTGSGSSGKTSAGGKIVAPNNAGADGGQDSFTNPAASLVYPTTSFNAGNYGLDVEVTTVAGPNQGQASGSYAFTGTATGHAAHQGQITTTGMTVVDNGDGTLSGSATDNGDGTLSASVTDNGDGTLTSLAGGSYAWAGSATGSQPAISPHQGQASGTYTWTGSVTGHDTHSGSAVGSYSFTGAATGHDIHQGQVSGTDTWTGSATGHQPGIATHQGQASGAYSWLGSATATITHHGTASGTYTWTGSVTGSQPGVAGHQGQASGSYSWTGTANGFAPGIGTNRGQVTGSYSWTGAATGHVLRHGQVVGADLWIGSVTGHNGHSGSAVGTYAFAGSATAHFPTGTPKIQIYQNGAFVDAEILGVSDGTTIHPVEIMTG